MNDVLFSTGRGVHGFAAPFSNFSRASAAFLLAAAALFQPASSHAVPYATCLTNDAGTISFRLNEAADNVKLLSDGGATVTDLGARAAGLHTISAAISGTFQVSVYKSSAIGFTAPIAPNRGAALQISVDGPTTRFRDPRGLAVNTDPASPNFGRVYVAHSTNGSVAASAFGPARTLTDGIYLMNADLSDAVGQGDIARTAGISFVTGGAAGDTVSPYRLSVGQDGNLYIADWSDTGGTLWVADPSMNPGSGLNVLGGPIGGPFPVTATRIHGSIAAAVVEGSLANANLTAFVIDEDLQNDRVATGSTMRNTLWRHDIGATLPGLENLPTRVGTATPWINFATQTMDLSRGTNGNFYVNDYRSTGNDRGGVYVLDPSGAELWNSFAATRTLPGLSAANDLLRATGGGAVSPHGDFLAVINLETNGITVLPLLNGIPDITNRLALGAFNITAQGREVAFDLAGNLYAVSSGAQALRVFSPGGTTTATTGSDGTFALARPSGVSVAATDNLATEGGGDTASFTLTRDGDTSADITVAYTLSGTAINGTDYETDVLTKVIPAGSATADIVITAIDDADTELGETVSIRLLSSSSYDVKAPLTAEVAIADNEPTVVTIVAVDANSYESFPTDLMTFRIQRAGETNSELFIAVETIFGTAINGADFVVPGGQPLDGFFILTAGQASLPIMLIPVNDAEAEDNESVTLTVAFGDGSYIIGSPDTATAILSDDDTPDYAVLYSDAFDTDTSANWITRFGANNGLYDADVKWAFDYSGLNIPPAPNSPLSSVGLFVQVNKTNATAAGSAGINVYPANQTFSGNYALRFDMLLHMGAASATEHALAGLNHSTLKTNRVSQSADTAGTSRGGDGVFVAIESDGSGNRDWAAYTITNQNNAPVSIVSRTAASLASVITAPPYAFAGSPGAVSNSTSKTWSEVELSQNKGIVTLKVNNNLIFSVTNSSGFNAGTVMLGMNDQFDSIGSGGTLGNFVIFDNVRVVSLDVRITATTRLANGNMQIDFISPFGALVTGHKLYSSSNLTTPNWAEETGAVITATAEGFRCVVAPNGGERFYRIQR